jgi:hypothetical protein
MWTIIAAWSVGVMFGLFLAALMGAAKAGDHAQEVWQAYQDGFIAGSAKPGEYCRTDFMGPKDA